MIQNIYIKTKNTESTERRKARFSEEIKENADLHKTVLNKIMTTQEQCVKHSFVAPLTNICLNKIYYVEYFDDVFLSLQNKYCAK